MTIALILLRDFVFFTLGFLYCSGKKDKVVTIATKALQYYAKNGNWRGTKEGAVFLAHQDPTAIARAAMRKINGFEGEKV